MPALNVLGNPKTGVEEPAAVEEAPVVRLLDYEQAVRYFAWREGRTAARMREAKSKTSREGHAL